MTEKEWAEWWAEMCQLMFDVGALRGKIEAIEERLRRQE